MHKVTKMPSRSVFNEGEREAVVNILQADRDELRATIGVSSKSTPTNNPLWNCDHLAIYFSALQMTEINRIWDAMDRSDAQGYHNDAHILYIFPMRKLVESTQENSTQALIHK